MKTLLTSVVLFLAIITCCGQPPAGYTITGNITGFPENTMFYLNNFSAGEDIDSVRIVNNKFVLKGHLADTPEFCELRATVDGNNFNVVLFIGNENIQLEGDITDFPQHVKVTGSKSHDEYTIVTEMTTPLEIKRSHVWDEYLKTPSDLRDHKKHGEKMDSINAARDALWLEFVKSRLDTYTGVVYLGYLKEELPKDTLRIMFDQVPDEIKKSKYGRIIKVFLDSKVSEIGDMCHDFEALDQDGNTVRFLDLFDGKYVLLDITQANCGPCVQSIDELKMIDMRYGDSLKIVSLYTDASKETWFKSLERDTPAWMTLFDGKMLFNSETALKYGATGTPTFILIDPQGKIIDIQVGYGHGVIVKKLGENNVPRNVPNT